MTEAVQFGRYVLVKKLASGGMAQVWLARQPGIEGFEKLLVIKQVLTHLAGDDSFIEMFRDEARLAAKLNHPNAVQVFDFGKEEDVFFIAMEYIHGEDLRRLDRESRKARSPIPIELVCRIIADAAAGLHYAHSLSTEDGRPLGLVHRDVSPQNVIVTFEGAVKVVDFGIAKAVDRVNKTQAGVLKGKYAYMSPEQASAKQVDARTDIFALGILFHELLTGKRLFKREGEVATLHAVVTCDVSPPSELNPIVPSELDRIVLSALERDPSKRMPDAAELQLALEDFLMTHRMPASSAHLRRYMRELFAERLEVEEREGGPAGYLVQRATGASRSVGLGASFTPDAAQPATKAQRPRRARAENTPSSREPSVQRSDPGLSAAPSDRPPEAPARDDGGEDSERSAGSASKLALSMHRRRSISLIAAGLVVGVVLVGGATLLLKESDDPTEGEVPTRVSSIGPGADGAAEAEEDDAAAEAEVSTPADVDPAEDEAHTGQELQEREEQGEQHDHAREPGGDAVSELDEETPEAAAEAEAEATPPPQATPTGTLRARVSPEAARVDVRVEGRWRPLRARGLSVGPGSYPVRVTLPDGGRVRDTVEVAAGRTSTYERSFSKGTLQVVIRPFGAGGEVRSRGRVLGEVPGRPIALYEGVHQIEVVGEGGDTASERVVVRSGEEASLSIDLAAQ